MNSGNAGYKLADMRDNEHLFALADGTADGYNHKIWADCPLLALKCGAKEGFVYEDDFLGPFDPTTDCGWTVTQENSGAINECEDEQGGVIEFDSAGNANADDGINAQLKNCMFRPAAGRKIWGEFRVKMNDATDQYFIGLSGVCTTIIDAGAIDDTVDKCGFYHEAASTDNYISAICSRTTSEEKNTDVGANADATWVMLGFVIDGLDRIDFYRNGVLVAHCTDTDDIPNAVMCLSAVAQIEGDDADAEMSLDMVRIAQEGGRN